MEGLLQEITFSLPQIPATLTLHCVSSVCFQGKNRKACHRSRSQGLLSQGVHMFPQSVFSMRELESAAKVSKFWRWGRRMFKQWEHLRTLEIHSTCPSQEDKSDKTRPFKILPDEPYGCAHGICCHLVAVYSCSKWIRGKMGLLAAGLWNHNVNNNIDLQIRFWKYCKPHWTWGLFPETENQSRFPFGIFDSRLRSLF